jgi:hypothetical protein
VRSQPDKRSNGTRMADSGHRRPRKGDYLQ